MLGAPWLVFSASARACSLEWCSGYALRSRARAEAENPAPSCTLEKSATPWVESRTGALTIGSGGYSVAFASGLSPAPLSRFQSPLSEPDVRFSPHLGSPVGSCVSHTGPRSHPWTTPMGLAPVPYSIHCRSRVAARPVDALTTPSSSDDPFTFACDASGVSGPYYRGFRAFATPGTLPPSVTEDQRSFVVYPPPTGRPGEKCGPARRSLAFRPACSLNRLMRPFDTRVLQTISLPP